MTAAVPDATPSLRGPVLFWAALATVALAYLAMLALNPDLMAPARRADATSASGSPAVAPATTAMAAANAEVQTLQQTVAALKTEIESMKAAAAAGEERERALAARLATAESATATTPASPIVTGSLPSATESGATGAAAAAEPAATLPVDVAAAPATEPPPKAAAPRKGAAPGAEPAPTAAKAAGPSRKGTPTGPAPPPPSSATEPVGSFTVSVTPAPPAASSPASPTIISRATSYGVQLASGPSVDALRLSWSLINERHKGIVKGLEPRFAMTGDVGAPMTLVAGPLATAEEAARICANLRAKRTTCAVVSFDGGAL